MGACLTVVRDSVKITQMAVVTLTGRVEESVRKTTMEPTVQVFQNRNI